MISRRTLLGAVPAVGLLGPSLVAQISRSRIFSRPAIPSDEVLRRLNLVLAWRAFVPMDGGRDGIIRTELDGQDLFVLCRSGQVVRIDAETGKVQWRTRVGGKAYTLSPFMALNGRSVYVAANVEAFGIDRETGNRKWQYRLRRGVSASPVADTQQLYVPYADGRVAAFYLPFVGVGTRGGTERSLVYGSREELEAARPAPVWEEATNIHIAFQPLQTSDTLFLMSPEGQAVGFSKVIGEGASSAEIYRFSTEGKIRVPLGQYGNTAYIGSDDAAIYAINMTTGKLRWRHTAGTAISRKPIALDRDVFVTSQREGMARLDRGSGEAMWKLPRGRNFVESNYEADRFLAANDRFVYAADRSGRLLVLDRKRGVRLSMLDTTDFRVPVINELTDRVYLAANNGLIVCLRDRDVRRPIRHREALEQLSSPVLKLLNTPITAPAGKQAPLHIVLPQLRLKYKLKFVPAERALKESGLDDWRDKQVTLPAADKRPLKDYLERILSQAGLGYQVVDDTILLVPGKAPPGKEKK